MYLDTFVDISVLFLAQCVLDGLLMQWPGMLNYGVYLMMHWTNGLYWTPNPNPNPSLLAQ